MPDSLDYSFSRPTSPTVLAAQGIVLVSRYLSPPPNSKNLTVDEAAGLHAAGIGVLLNWESSAGRPLGGAGNGAQDGAAAAAYAESIGAPHGLTIYYSCDTDTVSSQWSTIAAYYAAAGSATAGRYLVGVYGEADLIDYLHNAGVVTSEWQTYAWSNGRLSAQADLYQYLNGQQMAGAQVDFDRIIHPDQLGAWWPNGVAPSGGGTPIGDDWMTDPVAVQHLANIDAFESNIWPKVASLDATTALIPPLLGQVLTAAATTNELLAELITAIKAVPGGGSPVPVAPATYNFNLTGTATPEASA